VRSQPDAADRAVGGRAATGAGVTGLTAARHDAVTADLAAGPPRHDQVA
jgi:hypothetical protein